MHAIAPATDDARVLLERALAQLYAFPPGFPGYAAVLSLEWNGAQQQGAIEVRAPGQPLVSLGAQAAPQLAQFIGSELLAMLGQRWPTPFNARDGRYAMKCNTAPHPLGVEVAVDDSLCSRYRIRDGQLLRIERVVDGQRCVITVYGTCPALDGRVLPTAYGARFYDTTSGAMLRRIAFRDRYTRVDDLWLPMRRSAVAQTVAGTTRLSIALSNHRRLATLTLAQRQTLCSTAP